MTTISERKDCRACHGELEDVFDFGMHQVVNFGTKEDLVSPLHLVLCKSCKLLQLKHTVDPDKLFRQYFYRSGINQTMRNHLQSIVEDVCKRVQITYTDNIIDIGSNDGSLLSNYEYFLSDEFQSCNLIGFEPSQLATEVKDQNPIIVNDYFSAQKFDKVMHTLYTQEAIDKFQPKARIITAIAMFYDLDDPGKFLDDIKQVLAPDGLFVIEMNYLVPMLENNRVDNISAEHLCYYSVASLAALLERHELLIEDVKFDDINGGVFRAYIRQKGFRFPTLRYVPIGLEASQNLEQIETYHKFVKRVLKNMTRLHEFVNDKRNNQTIDVYGASTRGLMVMQLANLGPKKIRQAVERNPAKVGTKYNGIPVVSEETMRANPPDYLLVLAPDYVSEFYMREKKFLENGGKFIIPFPTPRILSLESI